MAPLSRETSYAARVALQHCSILRMSKSKFMIPSFISLSIGSTESGTVAQLPPDRWLKKVWTGGSAALEYSWFGVYKVSAFEKTLGEYDPDGVLHFTAQDVNGKSVQAEVRTEDGHLVVTITNWAYEEYLPNGTELVFYKNH